MMRKPAPANVEPNLEEEESAMIMITKTSGGKSIISDFQDGGSVMSKNAIQEILSVNNAGGASSPAMEGFEKLLDKELEFASVSEIKQVRLTPEAILALAARAKESASEKQQRQHLGLDIREGKLVVTTEEGVVVPPTEVLSDYDLHYSSGGSSDDYYDDDSDYEDFFTDEEEEEEEEEAKRQDELSVGSSVVTIHTQGSDRPPPKGIARGGKWSRRKYCGPHTGMGLVLACLCFGVGGSMVLCCPCDEQDVYVAVDGKVYNEYGRRVARRRVARPRSSKK